MFGVEFDWMIAIIALVCAFLVLTGHGDIVMRGGNQQARRAKYDEEKMMKPTGIAFLLIGVLTIINIYTTAVWTKFAYWTLLVLVFGGLIWYYQTKCRR